MADTDKKEVKAGVQALGGTAIKPPGWDRTGLEAFKYMLWNPETGEVLTRTPLSWLKIIVFYCIYYSCLAGFWIAALHIFFLTLPNIEEGPSWKLKKSIIGDNPGVGLRPKNSDERIDSQMFVLQQGERSIYPSHPEGEGDTNADYARRMEKFLEVYETDARGYNSFDVKTELKECGEKPYGFVETGSEDNLSEVAPCIFVKLNTIWDWEPVAVGKEYKNPKQNNASLPDTLISHITRMEEQGKDLNQIWIDCHGRYPADEEALEGLQYFPDTRGFPLKYFPYQGRGKFDEIKQEYEHLYHSPLVAIKVTPKITGQLIHIQCKAYYENVIHTTKDKQGMVQFEVQIKKD